MSERQSDLEIVNGLIVEISGLIETKIHNHTQDQDLGHTLAYAVIAQCAGGVLAADLISRHAPGCPGAIEDLSNRIEFLIGRIIKAALPPCGFPADAVDVSTVMADPEQPEAVH